MVCSTNRSKTILTRNTTSAPCVTHHFHGDSLHAPYAPYTSSISARTSPTRLENVWNGSPCLASTVGQIAAGKTQIGRAPAARAASGRREARRPQTPPCGRLRCRRTTRALSIPSVGERNGEPKRHFHLQSLALAQRNRDSHGPPVPSARGPSKRRIYQSQPADVTITCQPALRKLGLRPAAGQGRAPSDRRP